MEFSKGQFEEWKQLDTTAHVCDHWGRLQADESVHDQSYIQRFNIATSGVSYNANSPACHGEKT